MEYLAVKNWEQFQPKDSKSLPWIRDYKDKEFDHAYSTLTILQRYMLDACCRLRGRHGKNLPNDPLWICRATAVLPRERHNATTAIQQLISSGFLVVTNQLDSPLGEVRLGKESKGKKEPICAEASPAPEPSPIKAVILLPLNRGEFAVSEEDFKTWKELYPAVDVMEELRKMAGWCHANVKKRKTKEGIKRFINSWLSRAQDNPKAAQEFKGNGSGHNKTAAGGRAARNVEALVRSQLGTSIQRIHVPDGGAVQPGTFGGSGARAGSITDGEVLAREPARPKPAPDA